MEIHHQRIAVPCKHEWECFISNEAVQKDRLTFQDDSNRNENSNELIRALVQLVRFTLHYYGCSSDTTNDKFYEEIQAANNAQLALETEAQTLDHIAAVKYPNLKPGKHNSIFVTDYCGI